MNVRGSLSADSILSLGAASSSTASAGTLTAKGLTLKEVEALGAEIRLLKSPKGSILVNGHLQVLLIWSGMLYLFGTGDW